MRPRDGVQLRFAASKVRVLMHGEHGGLAEVLAGLGADSAES